MQDFKAEGAYVSGERDFEGEKGKTNLWGDEDKAFLEDVTLNLVADDDIKMAIKGKTAMKWDSKKKRYMLKQVDREGRVIVEKRNESGAKISRPKEKSKESIYQKWMKRTHLKLQHTGENEDRKAIE